MCGCMCVFVCVVTWVQGVGIEGIICGKVRDDAPPMFSRPL